MNAMTVTGASAMIEVDESPLVFGRVKEGANVPSGIIVEGVAAIKNSVRLVECANLIEP